MSKKEEEIEQEGVVVKCERGKFRVKLLNEDGNQLEMDPILCHLGGKMRKNYIRVVPGDKVKISISPYDLTKGRITYRHR